MSARLPRRSSADLPLDRRLTNRFPIAEEVHFRTLDRRGSELQGSGTTVDIGSNGLLFRTDTAVNTGRLLEISLNWPVALDGKCPLKLVAVGHVVRSGDGVAAVKIERYQFRTRRKTPAAAPGVARSAAAAIAR